MFSGPVSGQVKKRTMEAVRIDAKIKIDGDLSDEAWANAKSFEGYFYQIAPNNGAPGTYKTRVSVVYNNYALYVGAVMYDPNPGTIPQELGIRDDNDRNVDLFGIVIDSYNQGQDAFSYVVSAAGVQSDAAVSTRNFDDNWDAVWKSDIQITDEGWVAELEIPYSAMRFPKKEEHVWGVNFYRASRRLSEESTWNFIDAEVDGFIQQAGQLTGLTNIKPPLRLSFMPFLVSGVSHDGSANAMGTNISGGMDLKLGINESFTLDMSLIPDFSQVQSDNVVLNLSPFEVRFDENRPFFTEGFEMFNKGRVFYSRRVGQSRGYVNQDDLSVNEVVKTVPTATGLINATKISGRTAGGTGLGFFNAITNETYATIENTENGSTREYLIDPLTNFNVVVFDQNLKNNSSVGLINTNVIRRGTAPDANVTVADFRFRDKTNTWSLSGSGGLSQILAQVDSGMVNTTGYKTNLYFSKISGKFQFSSGMRVESDTWEINDLGFQRTNNSITSRISTSYNIYKPFSVFNNMSARLSFEHEQRYQPRVFTSDNISFRLNSEFRNFYNLGLGININPAGNDDYWEPRSVNRFLKNAPSYSFYSYLGTDRRKPLRIGINVGRWHRPDDNARQFFGGFGPSYRVSNKLNLTYNLDFQISKDTKGFVNHEYDDNEILTNIVFGNRRQNTFTNTVGLSYIFNRNMGLTFRLRHYWSWVEYDRYFDLTDNGELIDSNYEGYTDKGISIHNTSFNALNIDMVYTWQIAPGSFVTAVWKDAISSFAQGIAVPKDYLKNFTGTLREPHYNTISLKLIYYIDVADFRKKES
jgi:hypothetical protein